MEIMVDLIIIATLILFIWLGYKKGLTGSLIKIASFAIALILAVMFHKFVGNMIIENTQIDERIETTIIEIFNAQEKEEIENAESQIPKNMLENIGSNIENVAEEAKNEIVKYTAKETTTTIIYVGSGLVIFIVVRFILFIVSIFAKGITSLPVLRQIDSLGGIIFGALEGFVIIYVILGIISFISIIWINNPIMIAIANSTIGNMLYNNNMILNIIF